MIFTKQEEFVARIAHQCWCAYQMAAGQDWNPVMTEAQFTSQIQAARWFIENPNASAADNHQNWWEHKIQTGWKYGPKKDVEKKEHPDMVPFSDLPRVEKMKDTMDIDSRRFALLLWKQVHESSGKS